MYFKNDRYNQRYTGHGKHQYRDSVYKVRRSGHRAQDVVIKRQPLSSCPCHAAPVCTTAPLSLLLDLALHVVRLKPHVVRLFTMGGEERNPGARKITDIKTSDVKPLYFWKRYKLVCRRNVLNEKRLGNSRKLKIVSGIG